MRPKIVDNKKAFEQMKKIYETKEELTVVETMNGKAEAFDQDGVKRHELIYVPKKRKANRG